MSSPKRRIETDVCDSPPRHAAPRSMLTPLSTGHEDVRDSFINKTATEWSSTDTAHRLMSDYEVTLVNDNMQEFYVRFKGPEESESSHVFLSRWALPVTCCRGTLEDHEWQCSKTQNVAVYHEAL
jgi:hypothetical protein